MVSRRTELIVVLDVDSSAQALSAVELCAGCSWFKVGLQLFSREGPPVVKALIDRKANVFLDLKLHDIPNTVSKAAKAVADLGAAFTTVHASGGRRMIEAARKSVEGSQTRILAVTLLTSISDAVLREEVGLSEDAETTVVRYARMAIESGAHGVVASPLEIKPLRAALGTEPIIVTPGIRPAWAGIDDQARIMTPTEAARDGADYVVVGRPIFAHEKPALAVQRILEELAV